MKTNSASIEEQLEGFDYQEPDPDDSLVGLDSWVCRIVDSQLAFLFTRDEPDPDCILEWDCLPREMPRAYLWPSD